MSFNGLTKNHKAVPSFSMELRSVFMTALLLAIFASALIVRQQHVGLILLAFLLIFIALPLNIKVILFLLACIYPFSFGNFGPIPTFYWVEWMGPLVACMMFWRIISKRNPILPRHCWLSLSALLVLFAWAVINYTLHPVMAEKLFGVSEESGGLRSYYSVFVGICVFFAWLWFAKYGALSQTFWTWALRVIVIISLGLGVTRACSYFLSFDIPLVYGVFRYSGDFSLFEAHRVGGLSNVATIGIAALLALKTRTKFTVTDVLSFVIFCLFLYMSGGRSASVGVLILIAVFSLLYGSKQLWGILAGVVLVSICVLILMHNSSLGGQLNRLTALKGGVDQYRATAYEMMREQIAENPVLGKGIGYCGEDFSNSKVSFAYDQLKTGGHGSYLSVLAIWGIGGAYFLGAMLLSIFVYGMRLIKKRGYSVMLSNGELAMAAFVFFLTIIKSLEYLVAGSGYKDMALYMLVGILAGLYSKGRTMREKC
jgi:hypothetical protein